MFALWSRIDRGFELTSDDIVELFEIICQIFSVFFLDMPISTLSDGFQPGINVSSTIPGTFSGQEVYFH